MGGSCIWFIGYFLVFIPFEVLSLMAKKKPDESLSMEVIDEICYFY
jgi:hypothetical protein